MLIVLGLYSRIWNLVFHQSSPPGPNAIRPIQKLLNCQTTRWCRLDHPDGELQKSAVALTSRNDMISILQRSARTNDGKTTLILSYCVMSGFIMFGTCSWRPLHCRIRHSHLTSTQFHSRLGQSKKSAMGMWPIYKNYYATLVRKMAWY